VAGSKNRARSGYRNFGKDEHGIQLRLHASKDQCVHNSASRIVLKSIVMKFEAEDVFQGISTKSLKTVAVNPIKSYKQNLDRLSTIM